MADNRVKQISAALIQIYGENINKKFKLQGSQVVIGRSLKSDIRLQCPNVSRKHCILTYSGNGWEINDVKSQNGTYINGRKLKPDESYFLQCGDIVFLGPPSEMPQTFCYDDVLQTEDEEMEPVPEKFVFSPEKIPRKEASSIMDNHSDLERNILPSTNYKCSSKVSATSYSVDFSNFLKNKRKRTEIVESLSPSKRTVNEFVNSQLPVPKSNETNDDHQSNEVSSTGLNKTTADPQINEISSTEDVRNQVENSQSLLDIQNDDIIDPIFSNNTDSIIESHYSNRDQILSNSKETERELILKSKLTLMSEQLKKLENSKINLLKNYKDVCQRNKTLDEQLAEQKKLQEHLQNCELRAKNEIKNEILEKFEEDLICNICTELFIKPTVLECSHTFCEFCIKQWKKKKNECPICRHRIQTMTRVLTLEHFIDKSLQTLTPEQRDKRDQLIKERFIKESEKNKARTPTSGTRRRGRTRQFIRRTATRTPNRETVEIIGERRPNILPLQLPFTVPVRVPDVLVSISNLDSLDIYVS